MRKQLIILTLLSFLLLLFTYATVAYLKDGVAKTSRFASKNATCEKTSETLWEVITRQMISSVSLSH